MPRQTRGAKLYDIMHGVSEGVRGISAGLWKKMGWEREDIEKQRQRLQEAEEARWEREQWTAEQTAEKEQFLQNLAETMRYHDMMYATRMAPYTEEVLRLKAKYPKPTTGRTAADYWAEMVFKAQQDREATARKTVTDAIETAFEPGFFGKPPTPTEGMARFGAISDALRFTGAVPESLLPNRETMAAIAEILNYKTARDAMEELTPDVIYGYLEMGIDLDILANYLTQVFPDTDWNAHFSSALQTATTPGGGF